MLRPWGWNQRSLTGTWKGWGHCFKGPQPHWTVPLTKRATRPWCLPASMAVWRSSGFFWTQELRSTVGTARIGLLWISPSILYYLRTVTSSTATVLSPNKVFKVVHNRWENPVQWTKPRCPLPSGRSWKPADSEGHWSDLFCTSCVTKTRCERSSK